MIKSAFLFSIVFFFVFVVGFSMHEFFIEKQQINLPFPLKKVYLFHLIFSLLVCLNFLIFSAFESVFEQLGFLYLGSILLKITLFYAFFYASIITKQELTFSHRISLFIPVILFLIPEAAIVAKIMKKK